MKPYAVDRYFRNARLREATTSPDIGRASPETLKIKLAWRTAAEKLAIRFAETLSILCVRVDMSATADGAPFITEIEGSPFSCGFDNSGVM